ncbi:hypothetical protein [Pollutibacter soli]|uniref:hypothetical protein n=1 Tax=Pollutibacter soli TaxID=3034157 RepID=UPI003013F92B
MNKLFLSIGVVLSGVVFCQAQKNNDSMKAAKKMISEKQSQGDRILELKIKKQNLVLKSFCISEADSGKNSQKEKSGRKN